jgi:predicted Zn-dependent protease
VSTATEETTSGNQNLADLAERVAGWASSGEEVEVYVARGTETEVRAYDGEVESLTSATSAGIGIRVIVDHRLGFAWAGSLDESVRVRLWRRRGTTPGSLRPTSTFN